MQVEKELEAEMALLGKDSPTWGWGPEITAAFSQVLDFLPVLKSSQFPHKSLGRNNGGFIHLSDSTYFLSF